MDDVSGALSSEESKLRRVQSPPSRRLRRDRTPTCLEIPDILMNCLRRPSAIHYFHASLLAHAEVEVDPLHVMGNARQVRLSPVSRPRIDVDQKSLLGPW